MVPDTFSQLLVGGLFFLLRIDNGLLALEHGLRVDDLHFDCLVLRHHFFQTFLLLLHPVLAGELLSQSILYFLQEALFVSFLLGDLLTELSDLRPCLPCRTHVFLQPTKLHLECLRVVS